MMYFTGLSVIDLTSSTMRGPLNSKPTSKRTTPSVVSMMQIFEKSCSICTPFPKCCTPPWMKKSDSLPRPVSWDMVYYLLVWIRRDNTACGLSPFLLHDPDTAVLVLENETGPHESPPRPCRLLFVLEANDGAVTTGRVGIELASRQDSLPVVRVPGYRLAQAVKVC